MKDKLHQDSAIKNHFVVVVAYEGLRTFEFGCVVEFFDLQRPELNVDWYRFAVCTADSRHLHAAGGIRIDVDYGLDLLEYADTIVIPGWHDVNIAPAPELIASLRAAYQRGVRICSICTGVFVLAAAGLVQGKKVTTHWHHARLLATRYPSVEVLPEALYVDEGQIVTSAGSAAGLDMLLHLVKRDYGYRVANLVAQRLVIPFLRDGGQRQLTNKPVIEQKENPMTTLAAWLMENLALPHTLQSLSNRAMMSNRTLQRRFQDAVGVPIMQWITLQRIAYAKELLSTTPLPLSHIAERIGYSSEATFRHHFRKIERCSPTAFRKR